MPKVTGDSNIQWNMKLAKQLDKADGKEDGKISASVWNGYLNKMGSSGNKIKSFISIDDAAKSLNFYAEKKDAGKVDWSGRWEHMLNILTGKAKEVPKGNAGDPAPAEDPKTVKPAGNSGKSAPVKEAPLTKVAPEEDEEETMVAHDNSGKTSDIKGKVSIEDADENGTPETITITDNSSGKDHVYKFEFVKLDDQNRPIYKAVSMNGKPISRTETYTLDQKDGKTALIQYEGQEGFGRGLKIKTHLTTWQAPGANETEETEERTNLTNEELDERVNIVFDALVGYTSGEDQDAIKSVIKNIENSDDMYDFVQKYNDKTRDDRLSRNLGVKFFKQLYTEWDFPGKEDLMKEVATKLLDTSRPLTEEQKTILNNIKNGQMDIKELEKLDGYFL